MIDAWNLVWIVPVVASVSFAFGAWLGTGKACDTQASAERASELTVPDMCAECPFRPEGGGA